MLLMELSPACSGYQWDVLVLKNCYFFRLKLNRFMTVNICVCLLLEYKSWAQTSLFFMTLYVKSLYVHPTVAGGQVHTYVLNECFVFYFYFLAMC
jgi:hypothetical protein